MKPEIFHMLQESQYSCLTPDCQFRQPQGTRITIKAHPEVVAFLYHEESEELDQLEERLKKHIVIKATEGLNHERYEVGST